MLIRLAADGTLRLEQPDRFDAFLILSEIPRHRADDVAAACAPLGGLVGLDAAWIPDGWLLAQAGALADDPAWRAGLAKMTAFAARHGWRRDDPPAIRAHFEWA